MRSYLTTFRFAALPKPKETDWELELPEGQQEMDGDVELSEEDAAERDQRNQALCDAAERADLKRRTQVLQRQLPRPAVIDIDALLKNASEVLDPIIAIVAQEMALLVTYDALKYPTPEIKVNGSSRPLEVFDDDALEKARLEIALEMSSDGAEETRQRFEQAWAQIHDSSSLEGPAIFSDDECEKQQILTEASNVSIPFFLPP